jgi:hypothetical protein
VAVRENMRVVVSNYWHKPGIRVTLFHDPEKAPAGGIALSLPLEDFLKALIAEGGLDEDALRTATDSVLEKVKLSSSPAVT